MSLNVIWIDPNVGNDQNSKYANNLKALKHLNLQKFSKTDEGINYLKSLLKSLKFEKVIIIVSSRPYPDLVSYFKKNITKIKIIPIIIVFTRNEKEFLKYNPDYNNTEKAFCKFGRVQTAYQDMKNYLENEIQNLNINDSDLQNNNDNNNSKLNNKYNETQMMFEYINCKEKLILPLCFKTMIKNISKKEIEKYINYLYDAYSKEENKELKKILDILKKVQNIPIEILSKYFIRLYTLESNLYKNINKDLESNKIEEHLPFILVLYEGIKLKSLSISQNANLYCASKISAIDLNQIKYNMKNKIKDLPSTIVYTKSFLSFTKDKNIAQEILNSIKDNNYLKVLYIIDKDENIDYNLSTHADIEEISFYANNKEVLFFPFSSFEIKEINEVTNSNEIIYEIKLSYLSKYLNDKKDVNSIIESKVKIPESDYQKSLFSSGLISEEIIDNINKKSYIISGEILVDNNNKYEDIQIINYNDYYFDNKNQIEKNCQIIINGKKINFSFKHKFQKEGIYKIEYIFKNSIINISYMFSRCKFLTNLDLTNFNTKKVTNMEYMFENCKSLKNINLSIYNTNNVTNMRGMFSGCESLTNLNLSNFDTKNVNTMYRMFDGCKSLISLDLSNFNTNNVTNMDYMFADCSSLLNLDLSNFNIQNVVSMRNFLYGCNSLNNLKSNFYNMMNNNNIMNNNFQNNNMMMNNNIMMNNNNNIYANNNQMVNGNNLMNNMNYDIGMNMNNNNYMPNSNNFQNNIENNNNVNNNNEIIINFSFYNNLSFSVNCKIDEKLSDIIERFKKTQCPLNLQNLLDIPLFSGHPIEKDKKLFELGINNNDNIFFSDIKNNETENRINENNTSNNISNNNSNSDKIIDREEQIFVKEDSHRLVYCVSLLDWNCFICKKKYSKNNAKYYCSLCDFNLCEKCHSERNLPKRLKFREEVEPSNPSIKNPFLKSNFHEHNLIYCRSSRFKDEIKGWYCDICGSYFKNKTWSFYCTNCDYDLCCKCAGFN